MPVVPFLSDADEDVHIESEDAFLGTGEKLNITWNPYDLTKDLLAVEDTNVDISLVSYMYIYLYILVCSTNIACIICTRYQERSVYIYNFNLEVQL